MPRRLALVALTLLLPASCADAPPPGADSEAAVGSLRSAESAAEGGTEARDGGGTDEGGAEEPVQAAGTGDCCTAHASPGCNDPAVEACVCAGLFYCCSTNWDQMCADQARNMCPSNCGTGPVCGDGTCSMPSENCSTCLADCACQAPAVCHAQTCCTPGSCTGKQCGDLGCGVSCGTCSDGNPCTTDTCSASYQCVYTNNTSTCTDGDACTTGDRCADGSCRPGTRTTCDDGNPCTDDACNSTTGACGVVNNTAACSDGNPCTLGDACQGGSCRAGAAKSCADTNVCTDDGCNPANGECVHAANTAACEDGDACTLGDSCSDLACVPGARSPSCARVVVLAAPIGEVTCNAPAADGCLRGTKDVSGIAGLAELNVAVTACPGEGGAWEPRSVDIAARILAGEVLAGTASGTIAIAPGASLSGCVGAALELFPGTNPAAATGRLCLGGDETGTLRARVEANAGTVALARHVTASVSGTLQIDDATHLLGCLAGTVRFALDADAAQAAGSLCFGSQGTVQTVRVAVPDISMRLDRDSGVLRVGGTFDYVLDDDADEHLRGCVSGSMGVAGGGYGNLGASFCYEQVSDPTPRVRARVVVDAGLVTLHPGLTLSVGGAFELGVTAEGLVAAGCLVGTAAFAWAPDSAGMTGAFCLSDPGIHSSGPMVVEVELAGALFGGSEPPYRATVSGRYRTRTDDDGVHLDGCAAATFSWKEEGVWTTPDAVQLCFAETAPAGGGATVDRISLFATYATDPPLQLSATGRFDVTLRDQLPAVVSGCLAGNASLPGLPGSVAASMCLGTLAVPTPLGIRIESWTFALPGAQATVGGSLSYRHATATRPPRVDGCLHGTVTGALLPGSLESLAASLCFGEDDQGAPTVGWRLEPQGWNVGGLPLPGGPLTGVLTDGKWDFSFDPQEGAVAELGPLGTVSLSGSLRLVTVNGLRGLVGCLTGSAGAPGLALLEELPGEVSGPVTASVCYGLGTTRVEFTVGEWRPFVFDASVVSRNVRGHLERAATGVWRAIIDHPMPDLPALCGVIPAANARLNAALDEAGHWHVVLTARARVRAGNLLFEETVEADVGVEALTLRTSVGPEIVAPVLPVGLVRALGNIPVNVLCHPPSAPSPADVELSADSEIRVPGASLRTVLHGTGPFDGPGLVWEGSARAVADGGQAVPWELPGLEHLQPIDAEICVGAAAGQVAGRTLCGRPAEPGVVLQVPAEIAEIFDTSRATTLFMRLEDAAHLRGEGTLALNWDLLTPASKIRSIERLTLRDVIYRFDLAPIDSRGRFEGRAELATTADPAHPIPLRVVVERRPNEPWALTAQLLGRWIAPLGLDDFAIESGAVFVPMTPVKGFGFDGKFYFKHTGAWPPARPGPVGDAWEICDDPAGTDEDGNGKANCPVAGVPGSGDPACANDLACVAASPTSGLYAVGGRVHLEPPELLLASLEFGVPRLALTEADAAKARKLFDTGASLQTILTTMSLSFEDKLFLTLIHAGSTTASALLDGAVRAAGELRGQLCEDRPALCPPGRLLRPWPFVLLPSQSTRLALATRAATRWGVSFAPGLRVEQTSADGQLARVGVLDARGLVLEQVQYANDNLLGGTVSLVDDGRQREAALRRSTTSYVRVEHDARLPTTTATVEGWVSRGSWSTAEGAAALASKMHASLSASGGWSVDVGSADASGLGRVTVRFVDGDRVRRVRTRPVVPAGVPVHVAATWAPRAGDTEVLVYVNGLQLETEDSAAAGARFGPAPTTARLFLGRNMDTIDDVRLWSAVRSPADIATTRHALPSEYPELPDLAARWEFDWDDGEPGVAHNSRYHAAGSKLHGTFVNGAPRVAANAAGTVARLQLRTGADAAGNGAWLQGGARVTLPGSFGEYSARVQARLGDGRAVGRILGDRLDLLTIPGAGTLYVDGTGFLRAADATFEDVLVGEADFDAASLHADARLAFRDPAGEVRMQEAASLAVDFGPPLEQPAVHAEAEHIELEFDQPVGKARVTGSAEFDGDRRVLTVDGAYTDGHGNEFLSAAISIDAQKATMRARKDVPPLLGLDPGEGELDLTVDWATGRVCGSGSVVALGRTCEVDVCFTGPDTVSGSASCGGVPVCVTDADCSGGRVCLGMLCAPRAGDGEACAADRQCADGLKCAGTCYRPRSVAENSLCNPLALDHCADSAHLCRTACPFVATMQCRPRCLALLNQGAFCQYAEQCPSDLTCRRTTGVTGGLRRCLAPLGSRENGERCVNLDECASGLCDLVLKRCSCTPGGCGAGSYCGADGRCHEKVANGGDCCTGVECRSGHCSVGTCIRDSRGRLVNPGTCFTPASKAVGEACSAGLECETGLCTLGKCRCALPVQCPSGKRCNLDPTAGELGLCVERKSEGQLCLPPILDDCAEGLMCGAQLSPYKCFRPRSAAYGEVCLGDLNCASGNCDPTCNWSADPWGTCGAARLVERIAENDWDALAGCGCTTACACSTHSDCGSERYCAAPTFGPVTVEGLRTCAPRRARNLACSFDEQCRSNDCRCSTACFLGVCVESCKCR